MQNTDERKYRFIPKKYGRGFMPVSIEGWLFTLLLLAMILLAGMRNGIFDPSIEDPSLQQVGGFILDMFLVIFASLRFMDKHTRGDLKWRRGWDDDDLT